VISIPARWVGNSVTKPILSEKTESEIENPATQAPAAWLKNSRFIANLAILWSNTDIICTSLPISGHFWTESRRNDGRNSLPFLSSASKTQRFLMIKRKPGDWHCRCSLCRTSSLSEERSMKLLLATMFRKLPVRTTKQRATICKRCGTRIYSLSYLKAHLEAHDRKTH
jgi:hypothetical protein